MRRFTALTTGLVVVLGVSFASSASAAGPRDGIAHAKAAGITIDPRMEALMARARLGSCANDPTLAKCPTIRAVVFRPTKGLARFAQIPQCAIKLGTSPSSPYKAAGLAQMDAANTCQSTVTWQELYDSLYKFYNPAGSQPGKWFLMVSTSSGQQGGGKTIRKSARWNCNGAPLRPWHAVTTAYALLKGTLYGAIQDRYHNLNCG